MKIVIIGAGRVATHLALALQHTHTIVQIISRSLISAQRLAEQVHSAYTNDLTHIAPADTYIISTTDSAVASISEQLKPYAKRSVVLHTAGSLDMEVLAPASTHIGVLYPFQTFTLERAVNFAHIPLMLSWSTPQAEASILALAQTLGGPTYPLSNAQRRQLHISAIFACNFANHCYTLAAQTLEEAQLPFSLLHPLINETANKACQLPPFLAQTGPAIRGDQEILQKHSNVLQRSPHLEQIYTLMSGSIQHTHQTLPTHSVMINYDLTKIKAMAFDVDGVLSNTIIPVNAEGEPLRTANIKDGYALHLAAKLGFPLAIITGGKTQAVRIRYEGLGVQDVFLGCSQKTDEYETWKTKHNLKDEEILYVGDDIPDYQVLQRCGCSCCPSDAAPEIQAICTYISPHKGGHGVARDIVEQVLKAQGRWMTCEKAFGW